MEVPLDVCGEIAGHLCLRDFKAFRRTCKSFSNASMKQYRIVRRRPIDLDALRKGTIREFFDLIDEHGVQIKEGDSNVAGRIIRACQKRKLWDAFYSFSDDLILKLGSRKLIFGLYGCRHKVRVVYLDKDLIYPMCDIGVFCNDPLIKDIVEEVVKFD